MAVEGKRTTCNTCNRNVGLSQQPRFPGQPPSYKVAWHKFNNGKCLGVGEPRNMEQALGLGV